MTKIDAADIAFVDDFCKKKGIKYVDLRIELVDHLALQTEAVMAKNEDLSFKDAFYRVYQSYGIFGFSQIESAHQNLVFRKYRLEFFDYFKTWFRPIKLVAAVFSIFFIAQISLQFEFMRVPIIYAALGLYLSTIVLSVSVYLKCKNRMKGEVTLLMDVIYSNLFLATQLFSPVCIFWGQKDFTKSPITVVVFFILALLLLLANVALKNKVFKNVDRFQILRFSGN